jgi:hypothetical protein
MMTDKAHRDVRDADEVVREYYEGGQSHDAARDDVRDEFRDAQEIPAVEKERALQADGSPDIAPRSGGRFSESGMGQEGPGGDLEAQGDGGGEEAVGGSHALPDQDTVEEIGKAAGLTYEDGEPLRADDKVAARDANRWELNPASSEDYQERLEAQRQEPTGGEERAGRGTRGKTADGSQKRSDAVRPR